MVRFALIFIFLFGIINSSIGSTIKEAIPQENTDSHYCIVVGSFASLKDAKRRGVELQKDYDVAYRKNEKGLFRVCIFNCRSREEVKKLQKELIQSDSSFDDCWVLNCNEGTLVTSASTTLQEDEDVSLSAKHRLEQETEAKPTHATLEVDLNSSTETLSQQDTGLHFCLVVGSFSSLENSRRRGAVLQAKGYDVTYRESKKTQGLYFVCIFNSENRDEIKKSQLELKQSDSIFKDCWVLNSSKATIVSSSKNNGRKSVAVAESMPANPVDHSTKDVRLETKTISEKSVPPKESHPVMTTEKKIEVAEVVEPSVLKEEQSIAEEKDMLIAKEPEKIYEHYCLVIGTFYDVSEARACCEKASSDGYLDLFGRKCDDGSILVCMYNLPSKSEAEKRLDKMQHIDRIFLSAWVLGYDNVRSNIRVADL